MDRQQQNVEHRWKGFAMQALADNSLTLQIFCPELVPGATQGVFKPGVTTSPVVTTDIGGSKKTLSVSTANHVVAEWKSLSNEDYPPSVAKGEQVWLYQQANSDKFYWDSAGRDKEKRTLERRRSMISATPNTGEDKTDENTYFSEWNSKDGYVTLAKTSQKNGEPKAIYVGLNTKTGQIVITDNSGNGQHDTPNNCFIMDMVNNTFQWTNAEKSTVRIEHKSAFVEVEQDIMFKAKRQIVLDSPLITFNSSQAGVIVLNAASIAMNAGSEIVLTAARVGLNAVVKVSQQLIAAAARFVSVVTGPVGSAYSPATSDIKKGSYTTPSNASDTNTGGDGDKHVAAWEDVDAAFSATATAIQQVAKAVPTGADTSGITSNSAKAKLGNLKGT